MKCPNDQTTLAISERQNIEIDYCPECRGVWFDRGELDKILERSSSNAAPIATHTRQTHIPQTSYRESRTDDRYHKSKKKESFLGDIFDF